MHLVSNAAVFNSIENILRIKTLPKQCNTDHRGIVKGKPRAQFLESIKIIFKMSFELSLSHVILHFS